MAENTLHPTHGPREVERHQAAEDAQEDDVGDAPQSERLVQMEAEHGFLPGDNVGQRGCRHRRDEQGQQRGHRQVYHEHLQREHQPRDGCLEDAGHSTRRAASHEEHQRAVLHLEDATQIGADGRAGKHDGCLRPHRTAEADGDGAGQDG